VPEPVGSPQSRADGARPAPATNTGPGRALVAVYAVFAVGATSRAAFQIGTKFDEAPVPYLLSAFAAVVYIVATVALARPGRISFRVASAAIAIEMAGVLAIGAITAFGIADFPDDTVWSWFGRGYLFIPLVLPVLGLLWLRRLRAGQG
jgi:hypothetical protein